MEKTYNPHTWESKISKLWETKGAFEPKGDKNKKPFCIIMPPPNANGSLHMGHMMFVVEDIATRFARMQNRPTLWLPGTDHAGIETQYVFEKELEKRGKSRFDLGPEKFYNQVMKFTLSHQGTIISQMKSMGFSADWSKLKFTLDEDIIDIVYDTFTQLHKDGHIYRGNRIVNWCVSCNAAFADIEIEHQEREDMMYTLDYGTIKIATTRPETIFADTAVAVNPQDKRYTKLIGKTAIIPLINREVPIIADDHVSIKDGTGALKVTPAHDHTDYEIGLAHKLPEISVIDTNGKLINVPEEFAGLKVEQARDATVKALKQSGKLVESTPLTHSIAIHDRCKTQIEPLISEQWFLRVKELNQATIKALKNDKIKIYPKRFKKVALDWLENEHDWCISRQIWWGIHIPVYYKTSNDPDKKPYIITRDETEAKKYYGEGNYRAETDTFDTWFSSGQWPFASLISAKEFDRFYPTTLMATARDILHKWVTRMIMLGLYRTGKIPFENIYLWGMVTDEKGQKLSKSKGNYG
ncbi:MAG: valine--tRNA ligase, partial [bacterium]|nr:valine--tRNA ligase [bacterium]